MANELGRQLRNWRERVQPEDVGVPTHPRRRAGGLRREEVAHLAGVSTDYVVRLEQGRATHPSPQVLGALSSSLQLDREERGRLYEMAGQLPPAPRRMDRHVSPSIVRIVERLSDRPVVVLDAAWETVLQNRAADAVLGDPVRESGRSRNRAWRTFLDVPGMGVLEPQTRTMVERDVVADLHAARIRLPEDPDIASLVDELRRESPRFAELWETVPPRVRGAQRKTMEHPVAGRLTVDCDILTVHGSDLQIVVFSAEPGTPDADALDRAIRLGMQELSSR